MGLVSSGMSAQARRFGAVLKEAGIDTIVFGTRESNHSRLNNNLGTRQDSATGALAEFVKKVAGQI